MKSLLLLVVVAASVSAKPASRVVGGSTATAGAHPYQASYQWGIFSLFEHVCGASIISPTWVITAGHCVTGVPSLGSLRVVVGILGLSATNAERQAIVIDQTIVHPLFNGEVAPDDIALGRLSSALVWNVYVQPIGLPTAGWEALGEHVLSGWGSTSTTSTASMPADLQTLTIPVLPNAECNSAVESLLDPNEENPFDPNANICTGPLTGGLGACSGDSGGPLAQNNVLHGLVSWGWIPCGTAGAPSVYTRVSNYIQWIEGYVTDLPVK